jgi:CheY-like chemotaxis protein
MAKTAILIDDDPDDLAILKEVISSIDPTVVCISFIYPDEAVRVLLSKELVIIPDMIFIDINMPGITGDKCLKALRKDRMFDKVFIAMYSTSMPDTVSEALKQLGANYTFEKPVRMAKYNEIITFILEHRIAAR